MDPKLIALLALRTLGSVTGNVALSNGIGQLMAAYDAGKDIDEHMQEIADKLEAGDDLDNWDDIMERIDAEVEDFLDETAEANPGLEDNPPGLLADEGDDPPPAA